MARHILLIGGSREVHPKVKQQGLRLSMLFSMSTMKNRRNMEIYERIIGIPAAAALQEWIEAARYIHRLDPFDCIGGFNEPTQAIAAAVAQDLGLEFHPPEVIQAICQKDRMRTVLQVAGLDSTQSRVVQSADEIAAFASKHGYPIVLKPVDGRGSLSISILRSEREIAAAVARFQQWSPKHQMLVEQFLEGEEWSVEAFSERGQHRVVCITQKFKHATTSVETGHCLPAPLTDAVRQEIEQFVTRALTALGIANGPSHTEVILTAQGPRMVETHARLGGDSIVDLIQLVSGVDLDQLWIRQVSGESVLDQVPHRLDRLNQVAAISFVTPQAVGVLERVDGVEAAAAMPGVQQVEILQAAGDFLEGAYDSFSRGAYTIATGNTHEEAVHRARTAAAQLRFVVSCVG